MTEKELISQIKGLKQIKPNQNWVSLNKTRILGAEESFSPVLNYNFNALRLRFATASIMAIAFMFISYGLVENSLPGDMLYVVRRVAHKVQVVLIPAQEKPSYQLKLANDRMEDLVKAPARNLVPTLNELQANISEAARDLSRIDATTSSPVLIKKIVDAAKKLEENKQKVESLGVVIGEKETNELHEALKKVTEDLIKDLDLRAMSPEKQEVLKGMKDLFAQGKYSEALELYLTSQ